MLNKKLFAHANNAEIKSLFSIPPIYDYENYTLALERLLSFKEKFIVSNPEKIFYDPENELVLWVREYKVENLKSKGFYGNFLKLTINKSYKADKEFFTIGFQDLKVPLSSHPEKGIPEGNKRRHPNWGHPILRMVVNGKEYENDKEAESSLYKLFNEFPETSYAYPNRIITMVYKDDYPNKTKSFIFDVLRKDNGKYNIVFKENDYKNIGHIKLFNFGFSLLD